MKIKVLDMKVNAYVRIITTNGPKYVSVERVVKYYGRGVINHCQEYNCFTTMGPDDPLLKKFGKKL